MSELNHRPQAQYIIDVKGLEQILTNLRSRGHTLIGPSIDAETIVYKQISSLADLPQGWSDEQGPGYYRLRHTQDERYFNYTTSPSSWKKYLHPPQLRLWQAQRQGSSFRLIPEASSGETYAFIGVRPCELKAIEIQDKVFRGEHYTEPHYDKIRRNAFILAINCSRPNETCFCTSMNTGPSVEEGFDLSLTEFFENGRHLFLISIGSDAGGDAMETVPVDPVTVEQKSICQKQYEDTCSGIRKRMVTKNIRETLINNPHHPQWDKVAERCLSCANCTMVCPTCFCTTVEDTTDLIGDHAERWRRWDSCFTMDFSYVAGGHIRKSTKSRYRQWLTHKLASWYDQFETSGCVGCGRCITWCPVGIDITEEVTAIQHTPSETLNRQ